MSVEHPEIPSAEVQKKREVNINQERLQAESSLFLEYFRDKGYREVSPLELNPLENDKTVPFVGSTINSFKHFLINKISAKHKYAVCQPCIRTQDFENAYDLTNIPFGMPFFHIYGTYSGAGTYPEVCADAINYFTEAHHVSLDRLKVVPTIPANAEELLMPFEGTEILQEVDENNYYAWKYGINGVSGRGLTLYLKHAVTGEWWDVGNIVTIRDNQDTEMGVEFGIGLEFFHTALHGYSDPFEATMMYQVEQPTSPFQKKVLTCMQVSLEAFAAIKDIHGSSRTCKATRRYLNNLNFLRNVYGYPIEKVVRIAQVYFSQTGKKDDSERFKEYLLKRNEIVGNLHAVIQNHYHNDLLDKEEIKGQFDEYCSRNGIRPEEARFFVEQHYKEDSDLLSFLFS